MLQTRVLRPLLLQPLAGGANLPYLSAASGLVRIGQLLYVVADDEHHLGVFDDADPAPGQLVPLLDGELPAAPAARKAAKADCEALLSLPPMRGCPHGALLALGSGSRPGRQRGAWLALDADGAVRPGDTGRVVDLAPLLAPLHARIGNLNIEGAFIRDGTLTLLQRGNHARSINAAIDLPWPAVQRWLLDGSPVPTPLRIAPYELGAIDGVPLSFTDGAALPDGGWLFSAAAEDTSDAYLDGRCAGSVIGRVGADGVIRQIELVAPVCKVEGIAAWPDGEVIELRLVTDGDDRSQPGLLMAARLPA